MFSCCYSLIDNWRQIRGLEAALHLPERVIARSGPDQDVPKNAVFTALFLRRAEMLCVILSSNLKRLLASQQVAAIKVVAPGLEQA